MKKDEQSSNVRNKSHGRFPRHGKTPDIVLQGLEKFHPFASSRFRGKKLTIALFLLQSSLACLAQTPTTVDAPEPMVHWKLDTVDVLRSPATSRLGPGLPNGNLAPAAGAVNDAVAFDGKDGFFRVGHAQNLVPEHGTFSFSLWINPYRLGGQQQLLIGKNDYKSDQREWALLQDKDGRFRFYLWDGERWRTVGIDASPLPGEWVHIGVSVFKGVVSIYLNGSLANKARLGDFPPGTGAPLTIGATVSGGSIIQPFRGALDDIKFFDAALNGDAFAAMAGIPPPAPHAVRDASEAAEGPGLIQGEAAPWNPTAVKVPSATSMELLNRASFISVLDWEKGRDHWVHGAAVVWHKNRLYVSYGYNLTGENTTGEQCFYKVSDDYGKTWSHQHLLAEGDGELSISHGTFLSTGDQLWSFHPAFYNRLEKVHTRAFLLNESTGRWIPQGVVVPDGFWPLQEPVKMKNGNWIMSGTRVAVGVRSGYTGKTVDSMNLPAVAISNGDNLLEWDLVVIPPAEGLPAPWGEANIIVDGPLVRIVSRWRPGATPQLITAESRDYGRTWSPLRPGNIPMAATKPCAGRLSNGQPYLIGSVRADRANHRSPLTIAYGAPGSETFNSIRTIRDSESDCSPFSEPGAALSYPYATEHEGYLYVAFSNNETRRGNVNSVELAVIPIEELTVDSAAASKNHEVDDSISIAANAPKQPVGLALLNIPASGPAHSATAVLTLDDQRIAQTVRPSKRRTYSFDVTHLLPDVPAGTPLQFTFSFLDDPDASIHAERATLRTHPVPARKQEDLLTPLWKRTRLCEPVFLQADDGEPEIALPLLAPPKRIIELRTSDGQTVLPGSAWRVEKGTLFFDTATHPVLRPNQLVFAEKPKAPRTFPQNSGGFFASTEDDFFTGHQIQVVYEPATTPIEPPQLRRDLLKTLRTRLAEKHPLRVVLFGDSISVGANCSARMERPPYQSPWGNLVVHGLREAYGTGIEFLNLSMGGQTSTWGAQKSGELIEPLQPDLLIIAFGMNDRIPQQEYLNNIRAIMHSARAANPCCAFILVGPMQPNAEWGTKRELTRNYATILRKLETDGTAVADMWQLHEQLLQKKRYLDLTGNNANHPNDFLAAIYAQLVFELLRP